MDIKERIKFRIKVCHDLLSDTRLKLAANPSEPLREVWENSIIRLESKIEAYKTVLGDL